MDLNSDDNIAGRAEDPAARLNNGNESAAVLHDVQRTGAAQTVEAKKPKPASDSLPDDDNGTYPQGMPLQELLSRAERLVRSHLPQLGLDLGRSTRESSSSESLMHIERHGSRSHGPIQRMKALTQIFNDRNSKIKAELAFNGSFNHILRITVDNQTILLRVPKDNAFDYGAYKPPRTDRDLAILKYVREHTTIPIPEVRAHSLTACEILKSQYMLMTQIPGVSLDDFISRGDYSIDDWVSIATQLGRYMRQMYDQKNPTAGCLEIRADASGSEQVVVRPFDVCLWSKKPNRRKELVFEDGQFWQQDDIEYRYRNVRAFLITQLGRWQAKQLLTTPEDFDYVDKTYRDLRDMVHEMDDRGLLHNVDFSLRHGDLEPRNIMVDRPSPSAGNDTKPEITAILDWDYAAFLPEFVSCAPPYWLWADDDDVSYREGNEDNAQMTPTKELDRRVKAAWEQSVGEDFLFYTYEKPYVLARQLMDFALTGFPWDSASCDIAAELVKEWKAWAASIDAIPDGSSQTIESVSDCSDGDALEASAEFKDSQ